MNAILSWMVSSYELCHVSALFDCSVQGFHQPLPLSLRHAPLPPCSQLHFTHTVIRHSYSPSLSVASAVLPHHYM